MKPSAIRNFLGIFYFGTTAFLGGYIAIFGNEEFGTVMLPIKAVDAQAAFQIIIPTFIAQLTIIFKWYSSPPSVNDRKISIPKWVVKGPPVVVIILIVTMMTVIITVHGNGISSGKIFKNVIMFSTSLLGATSVYIISRVFAEAKDTNEGRR